MAERAERIRCQVATPTRRLDQGRRQLVVRLVHRSQGTGVLLLDLTFKAEDGRLDGAHGRDVRDDLDGRKWG